MGIGIHSTVVYLIDFGLSKQFRDPSTYEHISCKTNLDLTGTAIFASINSHLGLELGRRDDLESLAYILIYFLCASLPWQGLPSGSKDILKHKRAGPSKLCRGLPAEFSTFLEYSRSLGFQDKPSYRYIKDLFNDLSTWEGFQNTAVFDWDGTDEQPTNMQPTDVQPHNPASNDPGGYAIGQRKREGYVIFLSLTSYIVTSSHV